jgi:hypothetical protein
MTTKRIFVFAFLIDFHNQEEPSFTPNEVMKVLRGKCSKWLFQLERSENGKLHYQGKFKLHHRKSLGSDKNGKLYRKFKDWSKEDCPILSAIQVKPDIESQIRNWNNTYFNKDITRIAGPWNEKTVTKFIPIHIRNKTPYPFQETVMKNLENPNKIERIINVIYHPSGNGGKSVLSHLAEARIPNVSYIPPQPTCKEILQYAYGELMKTKDIDGELDRNINYIFDIPRALAMTSELWSAIEIVKDGRVFDGRHKSRIEKINPPHIWVFCNTLPNLKWLTKDKWAIWSIDKNNKTLITYQESEKERLRKNKVEECNKLLEELSIDEISTLTDLLKKRKKMKAKDALNNKETNRDEKIEGFLKEII